VPPSFAFTRGQAVYLEAVYHDSGSGTLRLEYDSDRGEALPDFYFPSEAHTRSTRIDSGGFPSSFHELAAPRFVGRQTEEPI
jgi:hypothetical protein